MGVAAISSLNVVLASLNRAKESAYFDLMPHARLLQSWLAREQIIVGLRSKIRLDHRLNMTGRAEAFRSRED